MTSVAFVIVWDTLGQFRNICKHLEHIGSNWSLWCQLQGPIWKGEKLLGLFKNFANFAKFQRLLLLWHYIIMNWKHSEVIGTLWNTSVIIVSIRDKSAQFRGVGTISKWMDRFGNVWWHLDSFGMIQQHLYGIRDIWYNLQMENFTQSLHGKTSILNDKVVNFCILLTW